MFLHIRQIKTRHNLEFHTICHSTLPHRLKHLLLDLSASRLQRMMGTHGPVVWQHHYIPIMSIKIGNLKYIKQDVTKGTSAYLQVGLFLFQCYSTGLWSFVFTSSYKQWGTKFEVMMWIQESRQMGGEATQKIQSHRRSSLARQFKKASASRGVPGPILCGLL